MSLEAADTPTLWGCFWILSTFSYFRRLFFLRGPSPLSVQSLLCLLLLPLPFLLLSETFFLWVTSIRLEYCSSHPGWSLLAWDPFICPKGQNSGSWNALRFSSVRQQPLRRRPSRLVVSSSPIFLELPQTISLAGSFFVDVYSCLRLCCWHAFRV